jgi:hypothetical protein
MKPSAGWFTAQGFTAAAASNQQIFSNRAEQNCRTGKANKMLTMEFPLHICL